MCKTRATCSFIISDWEFRANTIMNKGRIQVYKNKITNFADILHVLVKNLNKIQLGPILSNLISTSGNSSLCKRNVRCFYYTISQSYLLMYTLQMFQPEIGYKQHYYIPVGQLGKIEVSITYNKNLLSTQNDQYQ